MLDQETLRPNCLRNSQAARERSKARKQLLAHLVPQQLVGLVVGQVGVEQRDEDGGDDPLQVPEHILTVDGGDDSGDDLSLEGFFAEGSFCR